MKWARYRRPTATVGRLVNHPGQPMKVGDEVRTAIALPGIPAGTHGIVKEMGRPFVVVAFADGRHGYYARRQLRPIAATLGSRLSSAPGGVALGFDDLRVPGDSHMCLLPSSGEACANVVTSYAAAGLENGERLVFAMSPKTRAPLLRNLSHRGIDIDAAIEHGELTIMPASSFYPPARRFDPQRQLDMVAAFASKAAQEAPNGLRCCGFAGRMYKANGWWQYEGGLTQVLKGRRVLTLCVYDASAKRAGIADKLYETHTHMLRDAVVTRGQASS